MAAEKRGRVWYWGATPVPTTAMWTGEMDQGFQRACPYADGRLALCAPELPGIGRPMFKNPHPIRQRKALALMLCDICARPLKLRTKWLAGAWRHVTVGADAILATSEPPVCSDCLPLARAWCPHVGKLTPWPPRKLGPYRTMATLMAPEGQRENTGEGVYPRAAIGYLKLYLPSQIVRGGGAQTRGHRP